MSKVFTIVEGLENLGALRTGGQGSVYKGRRKASIYTAVKLLPTPIYSESGDDKNFRSFKNEVDKLSKVNEQASPYVVKILSSGLTESGSFPFIEMEYIEGPDLSELLQPPHPRVFTLREAIKVADQLASALAHCHRVGIMHGDIKSNNVRYNTRSGNYVLLDFGLALMSEEQRRTSLRHAGAIEFMAPEQSRGEMMPQTDVYSYGIIIYELLTGQVPFPMNGHSETERNTIMVAHMEQAVPDIQSLRREHLPDEWSQEQKMREAVIPQWLMNVINRCLAKDPAERYADGVALQEAVAHGSMQAAEAATVVAGISSNVAGESVTALQSENERLLALVNEYQQNQQESEQQRISEFSSSGVYISKPVFAGLILLLVVFMAFSGYSLFYKKHSSGPDLAAGPDTTSTAKPDTSSLKVESNYNTPQRDVTRQAAADSFDSAINKAANESKEAEAARLKSKQKNQNDSTEQTETDTTNATPPGDQ